jgi:hypothetical protein
VTPTLRLLGVVAATLVACSREHRPAIVHEGLGGDVARVGEMRAPASLIAEVARSEHVTPTQAMGAIVDDMILAQGARSKHVDRAPAVTWAVTTLLAGRVAAELEEEANRLGPVSEDERATRRVIHAVVLRSADLAPDKALSIARAVERAVREATSDDDFERRALAVLHPGARLVVQRVGSFGVDGQLAGQGQLDPAFVAGAFALHAYGETSSIVVSTFGWHILRRIDHPELGVSEAAQLPEPSEDVLRVRVQEALQKVLRRQRERREITIESGVDEMIGRAFGAGP